MLLTFISRPAQSRTFESDIEVLRAFRESIDPNSVPPYSFINSWDFRMDPCESSGEIFLGILCSTPVDNNSSTRVTAIDLDGIGYEGFLHPRIGNLTEMVILNLSKNNFRGPLPGSITNLRKLTSLSLSANFFTGTLPARIGQLKKLETLDVSQNNLSGSIPASISGLRGLLQLSLSNNGFTGRVPSLNGLWQLNSLDLSNNQLYGNLPTLPGHLRTLQLSHNIFSGPISSISRLQNLRILDLSSNRFSGAISEGILMLPNAVRVDISYNRFSSLEVSRFMGSEMQLQELHANTNHLQGHLPVNLVSAKNLRTINLAQNRFTGTIPREYGAKVEGSWRTLFLDSNFLTGGLPQQFLRRGLRISGSLAHNCLICPRNITMCHGGQRPASECVRQGGSYR